MSTTPETSEGHADALKGSRDSHPPSPLRIEPSSISTLPSTMPGFVSHDVRPGTADRVMSKMSIQTETSEVSSPKTPVTHKRSTSSSEAPDEMYPGVTWQWKHKTGFRDYNTSAINKIEEAYRNGETKVRVQTGKKGSTPMEIFFEDKIQHDPITGNTRVCQRVGPWSTKMSFLRWVRSVFRVIETGKPRREFFQDHKAKVEALTRAAEHDEEPEQQSTYTDNCVGELASHPFFFCIAMVFVVCNALWLAIDTDHNTADTLNESGIEFQVVEHIFCFFFTGEILIRFFAYKHKKTCIKSGWFMFDLLLVVMMIVETWIIPLAMLLSPDSFSDGFSTKIYVLRMFRLLRLTRIARLLRAFPEVMMLLKGMFHALRGVLTVLSLLSVLLFIFGVIFRVGAKEHEELEQQYFASVVWAMWSLLMYATFLDGPAAVFLEISNGIGYVYGTLFLFFIAISALLLLNMLIGILCEVVADVTTQEKEEKEFRFLKQHLLDILECYDSDQDDCIGKKEFALLMNNLEFREALANFGTELSDLECLADVFYAKKDGERLPFSGLLAHVCRLKEGNSVTVTDMVELREYIGQHTNRLEEAMYKVAGQTPPEDLVESIARKTPKGDARKSLREVHSEYVQQIQAEAAGKKVETLKVKVLSARQLRNADRFTIKGTSDPYCQVSVVGKPHTAVSTKVVKDTREPVWNEEFTVLDYASGDYLRFQLFDKDIGSIKGDDNLGFAVLQHNRFYPDGFEGELQLEGTTRSHDSYVTVKVTIDFVAATPKIGRLSVSQKGLLPSSVGSRSTPNQGLEPANSGSEGDGNVAQSLASIAARMQELCAGQQALQEEMQQMGKRIRDVETAVGVGSVGHPPALMRTESC
eukprot:TRINITY_DN8351_c0_g1_i2.p1 TRINITY_DN8351_c0_g1~~TRINITY_DN8351_c0_g1_i2.p1  ORF type:complete len:868 (-),score=161.20 TRINITY_DN8351_c0_g1_i2:160-2763(-)